MTDQRKLLILWVFVTMAALFAASNDDVGWTIFLCYMSALLVWLINPRRGGKR